MRFYLKHIAVYLHVDKWVAIWYDSADPHFIFITGNYIS